MRPTDTIYPKTLYVTPNRSRSGLEWIHFCPFPGILSRWAAPAGGCISSRWLHQHRVVLTVLDFAEFTISHFWTSSGWNSMIKTRWRKHLHLSDFRNFIRVFKNSCLKTTNITRLQTHNAVGPTVDPPTRLFEFPHDLHLFHKIRHCWRKKHLKQTRPLSHLKKIMNTMENIQWTHPRLLKQIG